MTSFDFRDTIETHENESLGVQDLGGLLNIRFQPYFKLKAQNWLSFHFSSIDQAFLVWGGLTLIIFLTGQFSSMSWMTQATLDAALTGTGIAWASGLTWTLIDDKRLNWVIFLWAGLMTLGMSVTAYGIYGCVSGIMVSLCPLWMGLCALGYGAMAAGMRSHAFTAACLVHTLAIPVLYHQPSWQYLTTGLVISLTLLFFSIVPWDMQIEQNV
ncbi:MAG: hypothetical protein WA949_08935 [Phormidesmis sp.]